jgi:hypothetical protein
MLDLSSIRSTAAGHGFEEIQLNEVSRVIAFEKHNPGRCRINIYYTTGTVATCLDHPCSGKTQLFRRNQTLHDIDTIFRNPRHHTGMGYYRNNDTGLWQPVDDQGRQTGTKKCDDARRWRYIHSTQEGFCNESQANQIAAFCKLWNQLRFASGMMTKAEKFNSMSPEKRQLYNHALVQMGCSEVMICEDCEKRDAHVRSV